MFDYKVYILKSLNFNRYYIGHSSDVEKRLLEHNLGKVRSTKAYKPWKIIYFEVKSSKKDAYKREMQIKAFKHGKAFEKLIKWLLLARRGGRVVDRTCLENKRAQALGGSSPPPSAKIN